MPAMPLQRSSIGRAGIERMSVNPISAIVGGIQSAVDHVAGGGEHNLRHIISKCAPGSTAQHTQHDMELQSLPIIQNIGAAIAAWHST